MTTPDNTKIDALLTRLGLSLESLGPSPHVDGDWPSLSYTCRLSRNGRDVWNDTYRLGLGHAGVKQFNEAQLRWRNCPSDYYSLICAWQSNPGVQFEDKQRWAAAACWLAKQNGVKPTLRDVVFSLLSDAQPDFDGESFAAWASNYGYDPDSRKAESVYLACCETGRALRAAFTPAEITKLREAFNDY